MKISIYQVDAFADELFKGNPAAVCPLLGWLSDEAMQNIAMENNLAETAFFVPEGEGFRIRWFTPAKEVRLCGHATLATAHVIFQHFNYPKDDIIFQSLGGELQVGKLTKGYKLNFPADTIQQVKEPGEVFSEALRAKPIEIFKGNEDYIAVFDHYENILALEPDFNQISMISARGVIATAPGKDTDFISRCFYPAYGVNEDPVTGSAHTSLIPLWAAKLNKKELTALQASKRTGYLNGILEKDRVELIGGAMTYLTGTIEI